MLESKRCGELYKCVWMDGYMWWWLSSFHEEWKEVEEG